MCNCARRKSTKKPKYCQVFETMPPKFGKTRSSCLDKRIEYIGPSKLLPEDDIPTVRGCLQFILFLREQAMHRDEEPDMNMIVREVYNKVTALYFKANAKLSFPVIMGDNLGMQKLFRFWNDINSIVRKQKGFKTTDKRIKAQLDKLFDIIYCQCSITCVELVPCMLVKSCSHKKLMCCEKEFACKVDNCSHNQVKTCVVDLTCYLANCGQKKSISCVCPKENKLPILDLSFVRAQRLKIGEKCAYMMGKVDEKESLVQMKTIQRKEEDLVRDKSKNEKIQKENQEQIIMKGEAEDFMSEVPDEAFTGRNNNDKDFSIKSIDDKLKDSSQNRTSFPTVAAVSMRYGASDRMTAAIATAALIDAKVISEEDSSQVLDHHKVHREKVKLMEKLRKCADQKYREEDIKCILFDGRKNWTKVMEKDEETGKYYQSQVKMEHIVVTSEPGGEYLFHFVPSEATREEKAAKQVANKIVDWILKYGVETSLDSLGGDSTNSNTGWEGGSFTHVEKMLGQKKMWLVCFLHTNELPLRHLMEGLDGRTNSDHSFSGPIGKLLNDVVNLDINPRFTPITVGPPPIELDDDVIDDLSTDQKYGYRIVMAIRAGVVSVDLANMDIGPICHSRWLTFANRVCRMYASKHGFKGKNLTNLKLLVEFIIGVYFPMWFEAKVKHSFINGPRLVLKQLELVRLQKKKVQDIVAPTIARSAWYSHSEAVLQTLLCSDDMEERAFAVDTILKLRKGEDQGDLSNRIRVHGDTFNPSAKKLAELCSWESNVFEPVLTCPLSVAEINVFKEKPMVVPHRPVHGQSMERAVKEVTRACESVFGEEARDGFIRAGIANRQVMPKNETKRNLARMVGSK